MEQKFYIVPSLSEENIYFLFRDYAEEIKVAISYGKICVIGKGYLTEEEKEFFRKHFV